MSRARAASAVGSAARSGASCAQALARRRRRRSSSNSCMLAMRMREQLRVLLDAERGAAAVSSRSSAARLAGARRADSASSASRIAAAPCDEARRRSRSSGSCGRVADDRLLLRREVVEEGARRDVGDAADLVDGHVRRVRARRRARARRPGSRGGSRGACARAGPSSAVIDRHGSILAQTARLRSADASAQQCGSVAGTVPVDEVVVDRRRSRTSSTCCRRCGPRRRR